MAVRGGGGAIGGTAKRAVWWLLVAALAVAVWNGLGHDPKAWRANLVVRSAEANVWAHQMAGKLGLPTDGSAPSWSSPAGTSKTAPKSTTKTVVTPAK